MIKAFHGCSPNLHSTVRVAQQSTVLGDVTLEEGVSVWYGAVLRAETTPIHVGAGTNVQDNCILHCDKSFPLNVGQDVTIGHGAILHGCTIGDRCVIGMGSILLNGCVIGEGSLVAAGALVTQNAVVPPGSLVIGSPAKVRRLLSEEELARALPSAQEYRELSTQLPLATEL